MHYMTRESAREKLKIEHICIYTGRGRQKLSGLDRFGSNGFLHFFLTIATSVSEK